jgi:hypothetical protein
MLAANWGMVKQPAYRAGKHTSSAWKTKVVLDAVFKLHNVRNQIWQEPDPWV